MRTFYTRNSFSIQLYACTDSLVVSRDKRLKSFTILYQFNRLIEMTCIRFPLDANKYVKATNARGRHWNGIPRLPIASTTASSGHEPPLHYPLHRPWPRIIATNLFSITYLFYSLFMQRLRHVHSNFKTIFIQHSIILKDYADYTWIIISYRFSKFMFFPR